MFCHTTDPVLSYSKLDVGHKMNSYTLTELEPSSRYLLRLHLVRNNQSVEVSRLRVTTRDQDYIKQHGIRRNYSAIIFTGGRQKEIQLLLNITLYCTTAGVLVGLLVTTCLVVVGLRVYRMRDLSLAQLTASSSNILQLSPPPTRSVSTV